ncbi:MAG: hypothetical protein JWM11_8126, partial [Planctomycetaceae bacterium]|nr:hypothetical protein [Planctomycetaceae bacterium]
MFTDVAGLGSGGMMIRVKTGFSLGDSHHSTCPDVY